jgi:flagellar biosynthesis protein
MEMKKAVALRYKQELPAPQIIAKGKGRVAEQILQAAEAANVPILEERDLVPLLFQQEIGSLIPENCYEVVAQILWFVYSAEGKRQRDESTKS